MHKVIHSVKADEGMTHSIAPPVIRAVLDLPLPTAFDFLCEGATPDDIGRLCVVPFGNGRQMGLIVAVDVQPQVAPAKLKPVVAIWRMLKPLDAATLSLFSFCAEYYHAPLGQVAFGALPPVMRRAVAAPRLPQAPDDPWIALTPAGRIEMSVSDKRAPARKRLLQALGEHPQRVSLLCKQEGTTKRHIDVLRARGWIADDDRRHEIVRTVADGPAPTEAQRLAIDAILAARGEFAPFLLEGVTGSGKTEVYLRAAAGVVTQGGQVLILLPEINLTPALLQRVQDRFPGHRVLTVHSDVGDAARFIAWQSARDNHADIVIGTRLAVFTPLSRLALVIVDEEHDVSLKQQEGVRYSARDLAVYRARAARCPIVLGSATPSLESLENAARGRFKHLHLPTRARAAVLPSVQLIDLSTRSARDGLTDEAVGAIESTVAAGQQAMVFINRRGYAPALVCESCGAMPECRHCAARLVFHRAQGKLECHHCGWRRRVPAQCENCGSPALTAMGQGTERIETALAARLPGARIARVDGDTTRRKGSAAAVFAAVLRGEIDVLVGTQLLAKGHDFPNVTLVVVVNADGAVFSADFRAAERLAQQLIQVAGRAGRALQPGRVLIQTRFPHHPVYSAVRTHDYAAFAEVARTERRLMQLPPYCYLALLRAEARDADKVEAFLQTAAESAQRYLDAAAGVTIGEPVASTLVRKAGYTRYQLLVRGTTRQSLQFFLKSWIASLHANAPRTVRWSIDVDPAEV